MCLGSWLSHHSNLIWNRRCPKTEIQLVLSLNETITNFLVCFLVTYKHQATRRHSVAWQDSLRYRRPDLDRMPGLRRITICKNPLINDHGAELIAEALKDDLWVKGYFYILIKCLFSARCSLHVVGKIWIAATKISNSTSYFLIQLLKIVFF